jgi:hypothetical protein
MNTQLLGSGKKGIHTKFGLEMPIWKNKKEWEMDTSDACPMVG